MKNRNKGSKGNLRKKQNLLLDFQSNIINLEFIVCRESMPWDCLHNIHLKSFV